MTSAPTRPIRLVLLSMISRHRTGLPPEMTACLFEFFRYRYAGNGFGIPCTLLAPFRLKTISSIIEIAAVPNSLCFRPEPLLSSPAKALGLATAGEGRQKAP